MKFGHSNLRFKIKAIKICCKICFKVKNKQNTKKSKYDQKRQQCHRPAPITRYAGAPAQAIPSHA